MIQLNRIQVQVNTLHQLCRVRYVPIICILLYRWIICNSIIIETTLKSTRLPPPPGFQRDFDCECHLNNMRNYAKQSAAAYRHAKAVYPSTRPFWTCIIRADQSTKSEIAFPRHCYYIYINRASRYYYTRYHVGTIYLLYPSTNTIL